MTECRVNSHCKIGEYCESSTQMCTTCLNGCTVCASAIFCASCPAGKITNTDGSCTNDCTPTLTSGNHCKDGVPTACQLDIKTPCECGGGLNCETCDSLSTDCGTCLKGYSKDSNQKCLICTSGYTQIGTICTLSTNIPSPDQDPNDPFTPGAGDKDKDSEVKANISGGAISGIVIGSLLLLLLLILLIIYIIWKNRKQKIEEEEIVQLNIAYQNDDSVLMDVK
ncbi:Cysteine-rich membrane protein 2 [Spironucleus salmonicida]|uniref:Cysteine-rich membrane protein 2 n=1 Tax=Spironucleus salmonicida TaxID=348837 RepID=V6LYK1_9EUKA|nr:Cysteine-rich membrane protein 2 [Spironucleus salmonicida]|eukprot:EST48796.1 Cysteine-rich membrane protein 2 [Spironucleus salmonicida]